MKKKVTEIAPAKVNLTLHVGVRRSDGYHEVRSVMQTVSLCDTVTVERCGGENRLKCAAAVTERPEDNLCMRAAAAFAAAVGAAAAPVTVTLEKRIPTQAGLGGGSSDAAAVLRAMRALFAPWLSAGELETMAATLGSDVPFFVRGGTALATGRGEALSPLPPLRAGWFVIVKPRESFSTAAMYRRLDELPPTAGVPADLSGILTSGDVAALAGHLHNSFESVVPQSSAVWECKRDLAAQGARGTLLSGSGSAVFGLFDSESAARRAAEALRQTWPETFLASPV